MGDRASPQFQHLENDYVIFDRKIAGNAQAISKNRWIHHTSFLIDFSDAHMNNYLAVRAFSAHPVASLLKCVSTSRSIADAEEAARVPTRSRARRVLGTTQGVQCGP